MRPRVQYTVGRLIGATSRPAFLFLANNHLPAHAAQALAVAMLASSLALVATAADAHRPFYSRHFATEPSASALTFYVYIAASLVLAVVGAIIVAGVGFYSAAGLSVIGTAVVYFLSEKLADEMLRLRLFEHDFGAWGRATITRAVLQFVFFGIMYALFGQSPPPAMAVIALTAGNLAVFVPQMPRGITRIWLRGPRVTAFLIRRAILSLRANWLLWTIALLGTGIGYIDRMVALVIDKDSLPLFMLVVMCFSVILMGVDFFYLSRHRRDFLQQRIRVGDALTSKEFLASFGAGALIAVVACASVLRLSRNGAHFPIAYVIAIAALQSSVAVAVIPREISYWTHHLRRILHVESAFWVLFASAALAAWRLHLATPEVLALAVVCALTRLGLHVVVAVRAQARRDREARRRSAVFDAA